jgi:hypothetical protein
MSTHITLEDLFWVWRYKLITGVGVPWQYFPQQHEDK